MVTIRNTNDSYGDPVVTRDDYVVINRAEYDVRGTASGWAVYRRDGSYAEFLGADEAEEAASLLAAGEKDATEYEWVHPAE